MQNAQHEKVDKNDPERCTDQFNMGQCQFRSVLGTNKCAMHSAPGYIEQKNIQAYNLQKWKSRLDNFYLNPNIKSLREEIAIARMTLEGIINKCDDENDLLIHSGKIQSVLGQIEKLVSSCNRIEDRLGFVLDKSAAINLADQIVQIVGQYIEPDQLVKLADEIAAAIFATGRDIKS